LTKLRSPATLYSMDEHFSLGILLRGYRERRGWTKAELARRSGYNASYISHIESGRSIPRGFAVAAFCDALELTREERSRMAVAALDAAKEDLRHAGGVL